MIDQNRSLDPDAERLEAQSVERWAALAGRWTFAGAGARYEGPAERAAFPVGLAVGSQRLKDGCVSSIVSLTRNHETAGGFLLGYQSPHVGYVTATLGGWNRGYAIGQFKPGLGWNEIEGAGLVSNLVPDRPYEVEVRLQGQAVALRVDGVQVISAVVREPLEGSGFGLFAWDAGPIQFSEVRILPERPKAFVIMPFVEPFNTIYRDVIQPVADASNFRVARVDEVAGPGLILEDIRRQIEEAHVIIAEVSTRNPNVFYELGYAHALRKPAVLLAQRLQEPPLPFDISGYRAILYDDTIAGKKVVQTKLSEHLSAIQHNS
jgi:hypothetical protein